MPVAKAYRKRPSAPSFRTFEVDRLGGGSPLYKAMAIEYFAFFLVVRTA